VINISIFGRYKKIIAPVSFSLSAACDWRKFYALVIYDAFLGFTLLLAFGLPQLCTKVNPSPALTL
jgi:hypothetical protein